MKNLLLISFFVMSGCVSIQIDNQLKQPVKQVYVENFTGNGGGITTDIIKTYIENAKLLTKHKKDADLIITGSALLSEFYWNNITFLGQNQNGEILLSGNATSDTSVTPIELSKKVAKQILKNLQKMQKK